MWQFVLFSSETSIYAFWGSEIMKYPVGSLLLMSWQQNLFQCLTGIFSATILLVGPAGGGVAVAVVAAVVVLVEASSVDQRVRVGVVALPAEERGRPQALEALEVIVVPAAAAAARWTQPRGLGVRRIGTGEKERSGKFWIPTDKRKWPNALASCLHAFLYFAKWIW